MTLRYAWEQALVLAALRTGEEEGLEARVTKILELFEKPIVYLDRDRSWGVWSQVLFPAKGAPPPSDQVMDVLAQRELTVLGPGLTFDHIQLNSPLEIALAAQAVGGAGVAIYALHLLGAMLRDPERVGGWLPRLAAGWRTARRDAERARQEQRDEVIRGQLTDVLIEQNMSRLIESARRLELAELHPSDVTVESGDSEPPEEITEALEQDG
jgi:hypothetical protein